MSDAPGEGGGWRTDPFVRYEQRWWDGERWTEYVSDGSGSAIIDPRGNEMSEPAPRPPAHHGQRRTTGWGSAYLSRTGRGHVAPTSGPGFSSSARFTRPLARRDRHVALRVVLGTVIATVVVSNLWFLANNELGRHGWLMRAGLGGTIGAIVAHFVSDAGRWRGFWAALLAAGTTVVVIQIVTPLAFRDTDVPFDSWGRNLVLGSIFGTLGAVQVARRRGRPPTDGGTWAAIGLLAAAAVLLAGVVQLRGGMPGLDGSPTRGGIPPELEERLACFELRMRARAAVEGANDTFRVAGVMTPHGIDAEAFDNPWFSWRKRAIDPPDDMARYELVTTDAPC